MSGVQQIKRLINSALARVKASNSSVQKAEQAVRVAQNQLIKTRKDSENRQLKETNSAVKAALHNVLITNIMNLRRSLGSNDNYAKVINRYVASQKGKNSSLSGRFKRLIGTNDASLLKKNNASQSLESKVNLVFLELQKKTNLNKNTIKNILRKKTSGLRRMTLNAASNSLIRTETNLYIKASQINPNNTKQAISNLRNLMKRGGKFGFGLTLNQAAKKYAKKNIQQISGQQISGQPNNIQQISRQPNSKQPISVQPINRRLYTIPENQNWPLVKPEQMTGRQQTLNTAVTPSENTTALNRYASNMIKILNNNPNMSPNNLKKLLPMMANQSSKSEVMKYLLKALNKSNMNINKKTKVKKLLFTL
jgi:hypothetical protein